MFPSSRRTSLRAVAALVILAALVVTVAVVRFVRHDDARRHYLARDGWPAVGQAAYRIGSQPLRATRDEHPVPIASLAKVMTADLVLRDFPLHDGANGFTLRVTAADVRDTARREELDQSVIPVTPGEILTERQALLALLLPSANNVAAMLARFDAGSVTAFVADMNHTARRLGMRETHYTDPSGYDVGTRSTARDQLVLAQAVARNESFDELVATRSMFLPGAGTLPNTDVLLGSDGFVGTKTGSDDAAGSCFMFRAWRNVHRRLTPVVGVVLGQPGHNLVVAAQYAARQLVDRVAPVPAAA